MTLKKYEQLARYLTEFIGDYSLKKGDRFLSIREIMVRYALEPYTGRQALPVNPLKSPYSF